MSLRPLAPRSIQSSPAAWTTRPWAGNLAQGQAVGYTLRAGRVLTERGPPLTLAPSAAEGSRLAPGCRLKNIRLLTLILMLAFAALGMSAPLITLYLQDLGSSLAQISLILASCGLVALVSNYAWGRLSDRLGRRKPLIAIGLVGAALAYAALSQAISPSLAWAARLVEAAMLAAYGTASLAMMGDLFSAPAGRGQEPEGGGEQSPAGQRGARMGLYRGAGSLAFAAAAVVGGRLADAYSMRVTLAGCALLYALAAAAALLLKETPQPARPSSAAGGAAPGPGALAPARRVALPRTFLAGVFLWTGAWMGAASMWPNYMASLGYSKSAIGSLWGLAAFVEAPASLLVGRLSDLFGRAPLLAAGGVGLAAVMMGWVFLAQVLPALLGVQVLRGITFPCFTTTAMTFTAEQGDRQVRGRNSGVYNAVAGAGQLLGLLIAGTVAQARGFPFMFTIFAAGGLLSALCFLVLRRATAAASPHRRAAPAAE